MIHLLRTTAITLALGTLAGSGFSQNASTQSGSEQQQAAAAQSFCDMPWANVDGNDDGFVSRDEARGIIERRFGEIDTDGNGEITKTEWVDCMARTGNQPMAEADRDEQNFADVDTNRDNRIDPSEFRNQAEQAFRSFNEGRSSDSGSGKSDTGGQSAAASESEDQSPGASLSESDRILVLRRFIWLTPDEARDDSSMRNMTEDEAAGRSAMAFSALDSNGDGIVDTEEWSQRSPSSSMNEDWASARFDELDSDASGAISREEYESTQNEKLDQTSTSSLETGSASASDTGGEDEATAAPADNSDMDSRIPVFVYRFLTY